MKMLNNNNNDDHDNIINNYYLLKSYNPFYILHRKINIIIRYCLLVCSYCVDATIQVH